MSRVGVMHVVDTLEPGGAERVAVNLVNRLPRDRYIPYLCTTRRDGPLADLVAGDVGRLCLGRRRRLDAGALVTTCRFMRRNRIRILHAHSSSIFLSRLAAALTRDVKVIWHIHFGRQIDRRARWSYRIATTEVDGVIAVSEPLADWSRQALHHPADRVFYIPNFVSTPRLNGKAADLPGTAGHRIVCVANLRWEKNHATLLDAMARVVRTCPAAHLLLVGSHDDSTCIQAVRQQIATLSLAAHVSLLGYRPDVPAVLAASDIAVLSSRWEGFPLALLEYGAMGVASIATRTGQCEELLDGGAAGLLVAPDDADALAGAMLQLLGDARLRACLGARFRERVERVYAPDAVMTKICDVYERVLLSA